MSEHRRGAAGVTLLLLAVFLAYYATTAWLLPDDAGPDYPAHRDAARFIYEHGRLPVVPADEQGLHFTPYGTTRSLRPPLAYLVSALTATALEWTGLPVEYRFRLGSAILCAAAVSLVFVTVLLRFGSIALAVPAALLLALLPQFTFLASYVNDDSGAMFAAALLFLALVVTVRRGLDPPSAALLGLAAGVVLIAKFTAWLVLPLVALAVLVLGRVPWRRPLSVHVVGLIAMLAGGGWWIVWNMIHYGIDDPLALTAVSEVMERHATYAQAAERGWESRGIGLGLLVVENYRNFIGESFKSAIGNLDWLRLRLGWPQYGLYLVVLVTAVAWGLLRMTVLPWRLIRAGSAADAWRGPFLDAILLAAIAISTWMYIRFNLKVDVQVQGKYLLTTAPAALLLFCGALRAVPRLADWLTVERPVPGRAGPWLAVAAVVATVAIHAHAWTAYVLPFYRPPAYFLEVSHFQPLPLGPAMVERVADARVEFRTDGLEVIATGNDPRIILSANVCSRLHRNSVVRIVVDAGQSGAFKIYPDDGEGFSEKNYYRAVYDAGPGTLITAFGMRRCVTLRLDPMEQPGRLLIRELAVAELGIGHHNRPR